MSPSHNDRPASPSPEITRHHSRSLSFPTSDLLNSIASGAHYSGALPPHHAEPPMHARPWRSRSHDRSTEHPEVESCFKDVQDDLEQLYSCRPTPETVQRRFREDATLEHPLFRCVGRREIAAVAFSVPRFVASLDTPSERSPSRILSAGLSPNRLTLISTHTYVLRLIGTKKEVTSVISMDLDDDMRIVQLVDRWNGEESSSWTGASYLRRLLSRVMSWTVRLPKEQD